MAIMYSSGTSYHHGIDSSTPSTPRSSRPRLGSRQDSVASLSQLAELLGELEEEESHGYGVTELRDGFFDAVFLSPSKRSSKGVQVNKPDLPEEFDKHSPLAIKYFLPRQIHELQSLTRRLFTTWAGIKLLRSFLAIFAAYLLCLVPTIKDFLGAHHSIMVVSVLLNQPGRPLGAQLDGVLLTILGTAAGLAWGVVGLLLSTSTLAASAGYGGILALFLIIFVAAISWIRAFTIRLYQAVICAGIAIVYTTLAETSSHKVRWQKLLSFLIPWSLGQAIAITVNCLVFPDAGARPLATRLHRTFGTMEQFLSHVQEDDPKLRRKLSKAFVSLSDMYRDMVMDLSVSRFRPDDVRELRNVMQAVIRSMLSLGTDSFLTHCTQGPTTPLTASTKDLLDCISDGVRRCDGALMEISGHRKHLGPPADISADVSALQIRMKHYMAAFDAAESTLLSSDELPDTYSHEHAFVQSLVFARRARELAATIQQLLEQVSSMQTLSNWPRPYLPSYPLSKVIFRTNQQIRHDRGGVVAVSYQVTFAQIERALDAIKLREHKLAKQTANASEDPSSFAQGTATAPFRYKLWKLLYKLQGHESQYALKACMVTSLLSVPSYLPNSKDWWDRYEAWWAVAISWVLMHTRVGGNLQDLISRSFFAILGAAWAAAGYAAGDGSPYVMGVFGAIYLLPMTYRFTQSSHPRSGLVACLSFVVISLSLTGEGDVSSHAVTAARKGAVFLVGTCAPILVNWILWPFVARHELRSALSSMLFYMSVLYRKDDEPEAEDIAKSELLEGRLREGFVRLRQLLALTRHETRLRAAFDPAAYSALIDACERFFEHVVAIRQSALFYNSVRASQAIVSQNSLLAYKRDAVASIMGNLYILAGSLRSQRKVPRYLPSAATARKSLLTKATEIEQQHENSTGHQHDLLKEWRDIYRYSFDQNLTGCVFQLEEMEKQTKCIVGEQGFDDYFKDEPETNLHN